MGSAFKKKNSGFTKKPFQDLLVFKDMRVAATLDQLDEMIGRYAEGWRTDRMPAVDRALLRMAVYELCHRLDVPTAAVLSEVVDLAGDYSTERSSRFVNGVVSAVAAEVRPDVRTEGHPETSHDDGDPA